MEKTLLHTKTVKGKYTRQEVEVCISLVTDGWYRGFVVEANEPDHKPYETPINLDWTEEEIKIKALDCINIYSNIFVQRAPLDF